MSSTADQANDEAEVDQYSKDVPWYHKGLEDLSPACRELFENYSHIPPEEINSHVFEMVRLNQSTCDACLTTNARTHIEREGVGFATVSVHRQVSIPRALHIHPTLLPSCPLFPQGTPIAAHASRPRLLLRAGHKETRPRRRPFRESLRMRSGAELL